LSFGGEARAESLKAVEELPMTGTDRVALVTGANKGIGLEIARQLGEAGVTVLVGSRDPEKGRQAVADLSASGLRAELVEIDVTDAASVAAAARQIAATHGRLDILVNNAGVADAADGPPSAASQAAVRRILETNFFGVLAVTQAMLPLLLKSPAGRVVNLTSPLGSMAVHCDPSSPFHAYRLVGYNISKAALNMLTLQLAAELKDSAVAVNAVVPGFVRTDLTGQMGTMTPEEGARLPVQFTLMDESVSGRFVGPDGELPW
jgi:NAD(P)-dependent dehydrogenase (short-subunit alcohol dehydrogenase family)